MAKESFRSTADRQVISRLVGIASIFVACNATTGGLFWPSSSLEDGVLDATWTAPTTNTDGKPLTDLVAYRVYYSATNPPCPSGPFLLTDLVSYRVYYSATNPPCPGGPFVTVASSTARPTPNQKVSVRLTGLTPGQLYYVAISVVNSRGALSACSIPARARARRS